MIEDDVATFLEGRVMILAATRDAGHRPAIGRGTGAVFDRRSGQIDLMLSESQWPETARNAMPGRPIAVTFARPHDYRAYQIKGVISAVAPADPEERARGACYVEDMLAVMAELGVNRLQLSSTLCDRDLLRIRFWPTDLFQQTPGPEAGRRLPLAEVS